MSTSEPSGSGFTSYSLAWGILAVGGSALWFLCLGNADAARAWRALLVNFMFFTSLTGGLVVWPAVVSTCNGRWHGHLERRAAAAIAFAAPSMLALVLLWTGSAGWSPWHNRQWHQGIWLNDSFLFGRDLAALALFWAAAWWYLSGRRRRSGMMAGAILIATYAVVFSLLGMDLVMALDPHWYSTLAGGYFFMSGLYIAIAGWTFLAVQRREASSDQLHDLGQLMVAFSLMSTYLMYAHLLPIWYENLPAEVRFVVPRLNFEPWVWVSYALLATVYFGPLVLLLPERSKRNRWYLGGVALLVLVGMWVERWWLIAPTFDTGINLGLTEVSAAAAFTGMLGFGMEQFNRRIPQGFFPAEKGE